MKDRCYNYNHNAYKDYGGRGITICDEWLNDFMAFYDWSMSNGYSDNLTIDRIDNNKGYSPDNCQYVSMKQQCRNRRNTIYITYNGKTKTLIDWCELLDLKYETIRRRFYRGWDVKKLFTPIKK